MRRRHRACGWLPAASLPVFWQVSGPSHHSSCSCNMTCELYSKGMQAAVAHTIPPNVGLWCVVLQCASMHCTALSCTTVKSSTLCYIVLDRSGTNCAQWNKLCCVMLRCAALQEAIELGASVLLMDEDTCATKYDPVLSLEALCIMNAASHMSHMTCVDVKCACTIW